MKYSLFLLFCLVTVVGAQEKISWYSTWEQGVAAAQESGRPILLMAAAPQCHGVSGVW